MQDKDRRQKSRKLQNVRELYCCSLLRTFSSAYPTTNHDLFCSFPGSEVTKGVEDSIAGTGRLREEASILGEHQYLLAGDG